MHPSNDLNRAIERALHAPSRHVERTRGGDWRVAMANGTALELRARLVDEQWLEMTTQEPKLGALPSDAQWWSLLRVNARLSGCWRIARRLPDSVEHRAEIFVGVDADDARAAPTLDTRVSALCEELLSGRHEVANLAQEPSATAPDEHPGAPEDPEGLARLCTDAGWVGTARGSGEIQVSLALQTTTFEAFLTRSHDWRLHAVVPLTTSPVSSDASRAAVALLLLGVSSTVRTVKGVVFHRSGVELAGVAAACETPLRSAAALDRTLAALSVACSIAGREVQALQNESLARDYLTLQQTSKAPTDAPVDHAHEMEDMQCLQLP